MQQDFVVESAPDRWVLRLPQRPQRGVMAFLAVPFLLPFFAVGMLPIIAWLRPDWIQTSSNWDDANLLDYIAGIAIAVFVFGCFLLVSTAAPACRHSPTNRPGPATGLRSCWCGWS